MKTVTTPRDLFFDQLLDLYSMERQLGGSLPELATRTSHSRLRDLLVAHSSETFGQLEEIGRIFELHGLTPVNDKCKAIAGLIKGGDAHLDGVENEATRDLMMIAHCLRIEHYEMAAYDITARLAAQNGFTSEAGVLNRLLAQEVQMAEALLELEPEVFHIAQQSAAGRPA